ncbi:MAG: hypothetical protein KJO96_04590 [Winogradskyella sp.]|nr:hypothetical protein [Winogradskyella sp.]
MKIKTANLRTIVLIWTILTTTFFWTTTMRLFFKPEISTWGIFNLGGTGLSGDFWFPPLICLLALVGFYIEGRGKLRSLVYIMLISWNLLITGAIAYGSSQPDAEATFAAWGITISFLWLLLPFVLFLFIAVVFVVQEIKDRILIPRYNWSKIRRKPLIIALLLFPVAILFFQLGTGLNWLIKIAIVATIIQWILLTEAVGRPSNVIK